MNFNLFRSSKTAALCLIAPVYAILPTCVLLLALYALGQLAIPLWLHTYCWVEVAFAVYYYYLAKKSQALTGPFHRDPEEVVYLFKRSLAFGLPVEHEDRATHVLESNSEAVTTFRHIFSSWFHVPIEQVGRDDVTCWLAWSLFDKEPHDLAQEEEDVCSTCLEAVERRAVWKFPPGSTGLRSIRLSFDTVKITPRPLILYVVVNAWHAYWMWALKRKGFRMVKSADGSLECMLWVPTGWKTDSSARPIVFLHGLGTGMGQYIKVIFGLMHPPNGGIARPVLIPLQPSLSMSLFHPHHRKPPSKASFTAAFLDVLRTLDWDKQGVDAFAHSMGTILLGWILKTHPELVNRSCFVDAVCFCLFEPHVPLNFLYRQPRTGIEVLMRYYVARELGIALTLHRFFDWTANLLWIEEIPSATDPRKTRFFLAGQDSIMSTPRVRQYLIERGVSEPEGLQVDWNAPHGITAQFARKTPASLAFAGEVLITGGQGLQTIFAWLFSTGI